MNGMPEMFEMDLGRYRRIATFKPRLRTVTREVTGGNDDGDDRGGCGGCHGKEKMPHGC